MSDDNPLIRKLESLAPLTEAERRVLERVGAEAVTVPSRTDLVREGDPPRGVFLVMDGIACRYKLLADGSRQITGLLVPGDFCDLDIALLDAMDHAVGTLSECLVALIPSSSVRDLLDGNPGIARAMRLATLVEAATSRMWLVNVGRHSCEGRLAHLLYELLLRLRAVGRTDGDGYVLPLTHADLADALGMTSVHVNRSLWAFRERGFVTTTGRHLRIRDAAGLRSLAAFNPSYLRLTRPHPAEGYVAADCRW